MATDALYFNNEPSGGNYFDLTGPALPNGDWAIGFWCRPDLLTNASASYQYVISAGSLGVAGSMQIFIPSRQGGEGCLYLRYYADAGSAELNTVGCTATVLPGVGDGSDYLFIVQRRGTDLDYYVVKEGSASATPTTVAAAAWGGALNSRAWRVGGRSDGASLRWLSNPMGELFVIGQSLTAAQIVNLASGKHIDAVVATRLLDLRFRGNNATESDLSGNGRNATRTGSGFSLVNEFFPDVSGASVTTPSISAPANGATGVSASPSFTGSAFAGTAGLTHASSDWQVASDSGFATIVKSASADTTNKTSWSTSGLTAGTTYYARVRYRANDGTVSSYSATVSFTVLGTVSAPTISAPANGATGVSTSPSFTGSAFAGTAGLTHASSDWQVASDSGFATIVKSASADTTNKTTWSTSGLATSTTYYVRVRYRANDGAVSGYSATVSFTTAASASVTTPSISAPVSGSTGASLTPSFTGSAFAGTAGLTHASSDWQVASDSGFATVVASVSADTTNKTTWTAPALSASTTYYARVRYRANDGTLSSYSATVTFKTRASVTTPSVTSPAAGATSISTSPTFTGSAFSATGGAGHESSNWQLATDSGFTNVVRSASADTVNKTSWPVTGLSSSTTYYVRVQYKSDDVGISPYSAAISFTTGAPAATVNTPAISSPASGAIGVATTPTFSASAFVGSAGLTHASSDWQVATDSGFTNVVKSASADTTNKTSWPITGLNTGTTYYARVLYRANDGTVSSYSATVSFTTVGVVSAPTVTTPVNGATGVSTSPSFAASAFVGTSGLTHTASDWRVATDAGFTNVVKSTTSDTTNKTTWSTTGLAASTTYYVRVRYLANDGAVGSFSPAASFTTAALPATLNTPAISSPTNGATGFNGALTLSGFSVNNGSDSHSSTTWQVSTSNTFSTLADSSTNDTVNKLSWTPSNLAKGTTYYARALVTGATLGSSSWSPTISFTTIKTNTPTVTAPAGSSTSPTITASAFNSTGADSHVSTSWQAALDAGFTTGLIDNPNDVANLTSWVPSLAASSTFYIRCRQTGQVGGPSAWSASVTYTTGAAVTEALPSAIATAGTRALFPYVITDTVLKDASIQETDYAPWDPATNYALGVKCIRSSTHSVYQRITPGVTATPPESDAVNWVKVGPTNRWGMFDGAVGTVSSATTSFTVILTLGPVNDAAFLNVTGSSIQIQLPSGATVTKPVPASPVAGTGSTVLFQSLGGTAGDYRITVSGTGAVSVGNLSLGNFVSVGTPKYGVNLGYTDYSVREVDTFGGLKLVPRPTQDRMDVQLEIPKASANQVAYVLAALRARPCVWLGVPDFDSTVIYGTIKSQSVRFSNKSYVDGQIQINALTLG